MTYARILGTGSYLPEKVLTNQDLEKLVDTSDEWIVERTGIRQRHIAESHETASSMAEIASNKALDAAGISADQLDLIIIATSTPDRIFPGAAGCLQARLGITSSCPVFDLNSTACAGFVYGLSIAEQYIKSATYKHVLLVGSEIMSRVVDWSDRSTCVLFGDGCGAMVLGASEEPGVLATVLHSDASYKDILYLENKFGGNPDACAFMQMQGNALFKVAVKELGKVFDETLSAANMQKEAVDWLIAHQANARIIKSMAKKLEVSMDHVPLTIEKHGNTSSASIPLAFDEVVRNGMLKRGDVVMIEGIGGGLVWGSALLKY